MNKLAVSLMSASVLLTSAFQISAAPHATVAGKYLDDFSRNYVLTSDAPKDSTGAVMSTLTSDGTQIYWNAMNGNLTINTDSILIAKFPDGGYLRFATSSTKAYKYCIFRMKGDATAKNELIYTRIAPQPGSDTLGISDASKGGKSERRLDSLLGTDSLPLPKISNQFQVYVVDLAKNGLQFGMSMASAFQIGTHAAMELDIDYIFASSNNPLAPDAIIANKSVGSDANTSNVNVTFSKALNSLKIKTNAHFSQGKLNLYDLQGKMVHSFAIHGQENTLAVPAGSFTPNTYLYTVNETSGSVFAKGKISLR